MKHHFPAWYYGPNGASGVFQSAEDVPPGWHDHPSKAKGEEAITTEHATRESPIGNRGDVNNGELDAHGWPWDDTLHAATKAKTQAGLWALKPGVSRPAPKDGYPLDL